MPLAEPVNIDVPVFESVIDYPLEQSEAQTLSVGSILVNVRPRRVESLSLIVEPSNDLGILVANVVIVGLQPGSVGDFEDWFEPLSPEWTVQGIVTRGELPEFDWD